MHAKVSIRLGDIMPERTECILIVEDSEFNAQVLTKAVSALAPVMVAKTGTEALDMVAAQDFDVILLDIMLPDIDGFEVCRRIVEAKKSDAPPIIFVTSRDDVEDEEKGLALGAVDYIYKPVISSLVQARVNNHLLLARAPRPQLGNKIEMEKLAPND